MKARVQTKLDKFKMEGVNMELIGGMIIGGVIAFFAMVLCSSEKDDDK